MNIVFFSNGIFGIKSLEKINKSKHKLISVVTNIAKPSGRGLHNKNTPVYNWCLKNNIKITTINNLNDQNFIDSLKKLSIDLFIVIEYRIIPPEVFNIPKYGTINLHASILPNYRGAAPIQRALMNGDTKLGLTVFKIDSKIDTGNIINSKVYNFNDKTTYEEAYSVLSKHGASFLLDSILKIKKNMILLKQDNSLSSKASKIRDIDRKINFNNSSYMVHNLIRSLHSKPGSYCYLMKKRVQFFNTYYNNEKTLNVGEFFIKDRKLFIGCKNGQIIVETLQIEGKSKISAVDFSNNQKFKNAFFE